MYVMGTNKQKMMTQSFNLTMILKVGATHLVLDRLWSFDFIQTFPEPLKMAKFGWLGIELPIGILDFSAFFK